MMIIVHTETQCSERNCKHFTVRYRNSDYLQHGKLLCGPLTYHQVGLFSCIWDFLIHNNNLYHESPTRD